MRTYYIGFVILLLVVVGMLLYPSVHLQVGFINTTGWLPLNRMVVAFSPYFFLFMIGYGIYKVVRR